MKRGPAETLHAATSNPGKLDDFATAAALFGVSIAPLPGLDQLPPPEETGASFQENAVLKAEAYSRAHPGLLVVADDSGLEVDALSGAPGLRSARFAADAGFFPVGAAKADARNNLYLLQQLRDRPRPWTARYRCVLAAAREGRLIATAEGSLEGEILPFARGSGGFGYDPLFWLPGLGCTMAEVAPAARQQLSHRGRALRSLLPLLGR